MNRDGTHDRILGIARNSMWVISVSSSLGDGDYEFISSRDISKVVALLSDLPNSFGVPLWSFVLACRNICVY